MISDKKAINENLRNAATAMLSRAKSAPKAKGVDNLVYYILEKNDIKKVSKKLEKLAVEKDIPFFLRDSRNIKNLDYIVVIGRKKASDKTYKKLGLENQTNFDSVNLGIALGSAVSVATDYGVDTRIMYTIGHAICHMNMINLEIEDAYGIAMSTTEKNIFFDRT